jgi:hypothetical protein
VSSLDPERSEDGSIPSDDEEARRSAAEADDTLAPGSMSPEDEPGHDEAA